MGVTIDWESFVANVTIKAMTFTSVVSPEYGGPVFDDVEDVLSIPVERVPLGYEPVAAGMSEIATVLSILADSKEVLVPVLTGLASWFGGPGVGKFRDLVRNTRRSKETGRGYIPVCVQVGTAPPHGSVRFYFHGDPDPEQLKRQWEEVGAIIRSLPAEALNESPGPQEYGYFWDNERAEWRGELFYQVRDQFRTEGVWFPPDLFDADKHQ